MRHSGSVLTSLAVSAAAEVLEAERSLQLVSSVAAERRCRRQSQQLE